MEENVQEDWLDARLREEASYIDDGGFTSRVVQKLPSRPVRRSYRAIILLAVTMAACVAAYFLSGGGWFIAEEATKLAMMPVTAIWICAGTVTILIMAGGLAAALSKIKSR
jgi:hypothetical protein